jgi:hypothetical protein
MSSSSVSERISLLLLTKLNEQNPSGLDVSRTIAFFVVLQHYPDHLRL